MNLEQSLNKVKDYINSGNLDAAQILANEMLSTKKPHPDALFLSACVEFLKDNYPKAISQFEKLLKKHEGNTVARLNLAISLSESGRPAEAIPHFEKVIAKDPGNPQAYYNLGNALHKLEKFAEAKRAYMQAVVIKPDYDLAYNNLGVICKRLQQQEEAIKYFRQTIDINPTPVPYVNLMALLSKENSPQAYTCAIEAVKLDEPRDALMYAYSIFINSCGWEVAQPIRTRMLEHAKRGPVDPGVLEDLLLTINCDPLISIDDTFDLHRRWGREITRNIAQYQGHKKSLAPGHKLKIAYLSPDFNDHSVGMFIRNIIHTHDNGKFEIYCYSNAKVEDTVTNEIRKHADHFIDVSNLSDENIAASIYRDGIHILVDLAGHTTSTAVKALAYRPAPLQITYLGYPNTTGLDTVDYRITDSYADSGTGTKYTEELIRMPECFLSFGSFEDRRVNAKPPATDKGYVTFGSFNHVRKLTPEVISVWSKILSRVPGSRLVIKGGRVHWESVKRNIINEFKKNNIDETRIDLHHHTEKKSDHLDFYNCIDIALDTFPYNGTTTTCEALWMGVPVITLTGDVHAQRVSYSILKNIGREDTITYTSDDYIELAVNLATDIDFLVRTRKGISEALHQSVLCDPLKFTRQLENLYCEAWIAKGYKLPSEFLQTRGQVTKEHKMTGDDEVAVLIAATVADIEKGNQNEAYEKLVEISRLHPENPTVKFYLGTLLCQLGKYEESIETLSAVIKVDPGNTSTLLNLGSAYYETGQIKPAIDCYKQILMTEPDHYLALNNLANIYKKHEDYDKAQKLLEKSVRRDGTYWISKFNLGSVYAAKNDYPNAIKYFREAIKLEKSPLAYAALIISLVKNADITRAYQVACEVIALDKPDIALVPAWNVFAHMCDWENLYRIQPDVIRILLSDKTDNMIRQTALLGLNAKCEIDPEQEYRIHKLWGEVEEQKHPHRYAHKNLPKSSGKLRVGYLSSDFNRHSVGYFIRNNIVSCESRDFETYCYSSTEFHDDITALIKHNAKKFVDIRTSTAEETAALIHSDGIHILIDLAGHTRNTQLSTLCYRPAPVQITYLGYPNTTGLAEVDFRITDHYSDTPDGTYYTEQLLYMPESFLCFGKFTERPINSITPASDNGFVTFGSFNNLTKLTPEVVATWSEILNGVASSRLIIKAEKADIIDVQKNIRREFSRHGISEHRIEFHAFTADTDSHLDYYNHIDIALDTFPYNGTTTTCEALWMGVPVITLVGKSHAQRVSYSILQNTGLAETITFSRECYIETAVSMASDIQALQSLHKKIPGLIRSSILCNPEKFTQQFEKLLLTAWHLHESGQHLAGDIKNSHHAEGGDPMITNANPISKSCDRQTPPQPTGLWTDYILKFPYASVLSQSWMKYIDTHLDDESWKFHQIALNACNDAYQHKQSMDLQRAALMRGYHVLFQLANVGGNISNLQTFSRIAMELGEYENALFALNYIASIIESQTEITLAEPFLCVTEYFEAVDPGTNVGAWVYASVLYQIEVIERLLSSATEQTTYERMKKIKRTGFFDVKLENWWNSNVSGAGTGDQKSLNKNRRLHIGGKQVHPEWEIINAIPGPGVNHLGNAKDLSQFQDNCFTEIYGSHVLEHFNYANELPAVLKEWYRVLKPGGKLYISVPDLDKLAALFINKKQLNLEQRFHVMRMIFGGQVDEYDFHKVGLNQEILQIYLEQAGFENISVVDSLGIFADTSDYKPYGVAISINVIAQKPLTHEVVSKKIHTANKTIEVFDDDIFLVSYPRSGNTWMRFLLAMIIKKSADVNFDNIEKYIPDLYRNGNDDLMKIDRPRIIKSHEICNPGYPRVIYLVRDVRDVLVSCYHYTLKMGNNYSFDEYFNRHMMNDNHPQKFGTWGMNVRSWLDSRNSIALIRYEDLLARPENSIKTLLDKLSVEYDDSVIKLATSSCSFTNMREKEDKAQNINYLDENRENKFIRQGRVGVWHEYFTAEHIAKIKSEYGGLLIELGYEKDLDWE